MEREERMSGMIQRKEKWELDEWDRHGIVLIVLGEGVQVQLSKEGGGSYL